METQNESTGLDRRTFLTQIILAGVSVGVFPGLQSCKKSGSKKGFAGTGLPPYKVYEEILHHLKTSPDHLLGRMEQLVAEGNPEAMFLFVRDEFLLIPADTYGLGGGNDHKWGVDYALRSGYATAREKADILNSMYTKAGITSKVMTERTDFSPEEVANFFFRPFQHAFNPDISKKVLKKWRQELGKPSSPLALNFTLADQNELGEQLGQKILQELKLPDDHYYKPFSFRWDNYNTPTVAFELDGETKYAHLFDTSVPFGESKTNEPTYLKDAKDPTPNTNKLSLTISYRDSIEPSTEKELISGEWLAADLAGHQLDVLFLNNLILEQAAVTPIGSVRTFTPALSLQAIGKAEEFMAERSVLADPFTLAGKRIQLGADNEPVKIGEAVLLEKPKPDLQKQVAELAVSAKSTGYPNVKLSVTPTNAAGEMIEGLSAPDFKILEDGMPVNALMESNQRTPRILIMADRSGSMPKEFSGKGMEAFIEQLKAQILEQYPAAIITYWGTPSNLFTWLLKGSQTENDLVIFATDGDNNDKYDPANEAVYKSGPPTIVLDVKGSNYQFYKDTFQKMAEVTNGMHLTALDQQAAMEGIGKYLESLEIQPYTFTYAAAGESNERTVTVSVDKERISGTGKYSPERGKATQLGPKVIGLYLELKYSNQYAVKRVLAGWDNKIEKPAAISQAMADSVRDIMMGKIQLSFEGAGPTASAALSDILSARLSMREFGEALQKDDFEKAKEELTKGQINLSPSLLAMMAPLDVPATKSTFTIPGGLRIGMQTFDPGYSTGEAQDKFDYFPTSEYVTLATDSKAGFETTIQKTAQLAIREQKMYGISTASELEDKKLINIGDARERKWLLERREAGDEQYWRERVFRGARLRLFDERAASRAFWDVHHQTGELYGILADGSGGGNCNFHHQVKEFEKITAALSSLILVVSLTPGFSPIGAVSLGIVAQYGLTLVKLYAIVSETIIIMDADGMSKSLKAQLQAFARAAHKEIVLGLAGLAGTAYAGLENLITMIGDDDGKCPY